MPYSLIQRQEIRLMANTQRKQHVPIFVGSTYEDLKEYRRAVRDALHRLETIVRGMEYFGSKPGKPVEECLKTVRSCKVYIGIFAMRYGSIPENHRISMTHLEYEEAQRIELPSLIYLIDEKNQPIIPAYVETGEGAQKLASLKDKLRNEHIVSLFTSPEDLALKILQDIPPVLEEIGAEIEGELEIEKPENSLEILKRFLLLPKRLSGKEVIIEFDNDSEYGDGFHSASADHCDALDLEAGATLYDYLKIKDHNDHWYIYAEGELAEKILRIPKGSIVKARAITIYGVEREVRMSFDLERDYEFKNELRGLLLKEILKVNRKM